GPYAVGSSAAAIHGGGVNRAVDQRQIRGLRARGKERDRLDSIQSVMQSQTVENAIIRDGIGCIRSGEGTSPATTPAPESTTTASGAATTAASEAAALSSRSEGGSSDCGGW